MSLLEHPLLIEEHDHCVPSIDSIQKGIEFISPLFDTEFTIDNCEYIALHGLMSGNKPVSQSDSDLRFDILQSDYRKQTGAHIDERHLGLLIIRRMLKTIDLESL